MRAMQINKAVPYLFQEAERRLRSIDELPVATRNREDALEQKLTFFARVDPLLAEHPIYFRHFIQLKQRFNRALVGSGSNKRLVRAFAKNQFESANNDRFTGACLPGHNAETRGQLPVQRFDQS